MSHGCGCRVCLTTHELVAAVLDEWSESRGEVFKDLKVARAAWGRLNRAVEAYLRARSIHA